MTSLESLQPSQELLFSLCNLSVMEQCPNQLDLDYFINALRGIYPEFNMNRELMITELIHHTNDISSVVSDLVIWCRCYQPEISFNNQSITFTSQSGMISMPPNLREDDESIQVMRSTDLVSIIVSFPESVSMYYLEGLFWMMYSDPFKLLCSQGYVGNINQPCRFFHDLISVSSGSSDTLRDILALDPKFSLRSLIQLALRKRELSKLCDNPCIPLMSQGQGAYFKSNIDESIVSIQADLLRTTYG
uniref:Uncharacterized protein n=1 Tax=viral metagenome TaxID=1070528 RepID=A0A6C0BNA7_9ZZZZ